MIIDKFTLPVAWIPTVFEVDELAFGSSDMLYKGVIVIGNRGLENDICNLMTRR
jgi:hypothetical protein